MFGLPLSGWKRPDPPPRDADGAALGAAVEEMVQARMDMLRATLRARAAFLRASAAGSDSQAVRAECLARAAEIDFILGQELKP